MASMTITGKFLGAGKTRPVGKNDLLVRTFWLDLTTNPDYPNTPEFQLRGDRVGLVNELKKGQSIQVTFNLNGRKYTKQDGTEAVMTNLDAWKVDLIVVKSAVAAGAGDIAAEGEPDDLPF